MNGISMLDDYGVLVEPATLEIRRLLPGPVGRVWSYLTDSDRRRRWLAAGDMDLAVDAPFEFVWRNDELTDPPGTRPEGFSEEHRMQSRITEIDPPRRLAFTWGEDGEVSFELEERGDEVLLTLIHRRIPDRTQTVMVGSGWHMHLDILRARLSGTEPDPFWDGWKALREEYDKRVPA
jgi:uncharacterized protein YndB with AHSA1/START domain